MMRGRISCIVSRAICSQNLLAQATLSVCDEGKWLQNRCQSTKANDTFKSKDSLSDFFRNLGEYDSVDSVNVKVLEEAREISQLYTKSFHPHHGEYDVDLLARFLQIEKHGGAHNCHMDALNFVKMTSKHRTLVHEKLQRQLHQEYNMYDDAVAMYRDMIDNVYSLGRGSQLKPEHTMLVKLFLPFSQAIEKEQEAINMGQSGKDRAVYGPHLAQLEAAKLAVISLTECLNQLLMSGAVPFVTLAGTIGESVNTEVNLARLKRDDVWKSLKKELDFTKTKIDRQLINHLAARLGHDLDAPQEATQIWESKIQIKVGSALLKLLMESGTVTTPSGGIVHAVQHIYQPTYHKWQRNKAYQKQGAIQLHESVLDMLSETHMFRELLWPRFMPMVVPPKPWKLSGGSPMEGAAHSGGYLKLPCQFMRTKGSRVQMDVLNRCNLKEVHDALNFLGCIPWMINKEVLTIVNQVWEDGGGIADIPRQRAYEITELPLTDFASEEEKENHDRLMRKLQDKNKDLRSLQADMAIKLNIATSFQDEEEIYFPVNLDFRGRVYPVPPNLNHIGSDMCRGILTFADTRELGAKGLEWLKIHVANLAGEDKSSLRERREFTERHIQQVFDSADRPLDGSRWWMQSDKPWQTLAACKELVAALRHPEGAEKYPSRLPVHQDGSCNGLQHYAALGRDIAGAQQVNLWQVGDKPGDVYTGVLELVIRDIQQHSRGNFDGDFNHNEGAGETNQKPKSTRLKRFSPERIQYLAQMVLPHINRKTVKQTVMTTVYGVTFIGAARQIYNRLSEFAEPGQPLEHVEDRDVFDAASYVADLTLRSVGRLFEGADRVKQWLLHVAKKVSRIGEPVSWITPLGLPIVQPYRQPKKHSIPTVVQTVILSTVDDQLPVHLTRQCSAFPPNYVHSLDSTHMLMTALRCKERGLVFTAVHDSYWTHAATVDDMNADLREAFVEMHDRALLEDLRNSVTLRFPELEIDPVPPLGDFDLEHVYESKYFFN